MKYKKWGTGFYFSGVALYMGAWIEISTSESTKNLEMVALYMGAWIEIFYHLHQTCILSVALYMGAWIEIDNEKTECQMSVGRTLYGCVD